MIGHGSPSPRPSVSRAGPMVRIRLPPAGSQRRTHRDRRGAAHRLIFVWLYRLCPSVRQAAVVVKPETLVCWHRSGFRLYWRWKSRRRVGRPAVPADIRDLIRTISRDNPLWGRHAFMASC